MDKIFTEYLVDCFKHLNLDMALFINAAPVHQLKHPLFEKHGVEVIVKREDMLHPLVSGNKWRKLKYNLAAANDQGLEQILTFGGAYSNHLYATAAACNAVGFESIGVVRGDPVFPLNPTLDFAMKKGMSLHYISRKDYREKDNNGILKKLNEQYPYAYVVPEGGSNILGIKGCMELLKEVDEPFDVVAVPCGTGATLAGIVLSLEDHQSAIGFSVMKGGDFLNKEVLNHVQAVLEDPFPSPNLTRSFLVETRYHFGGYARYTPELANFMTGFYNDHEIRLDPIYTAKMAYGIYDLIERKNFPRGTRILMIHTGGLQGLAGFEERFGESFYSDN